MAGGHRGYGQIAVDYRYRGDLYQQMQVTPDGSHWFIRYPAGSWPDPHRERCVSSQKQLYPVYSIQEPPGGGGVQCIPFDDPRICHISSALGGNSLTDADKIRHIRNELPSVTMSEPAPDNSAFLPPPLGPFITAKLADEAKQTSSDYDNDNKRWQNNLHKENVDNLPPSDQNCNNRHPKLQLSSLSPSSAFQAPLTRASSHQGSSSGQVFTETITQVKKIAPDSRPESIRNTKRRVSETIFCLVSVPVRTPTNFSKTLSADPNNNKAITNLTVANTFAVGLRESPNIRSKSVNEMPIKSCYSHFHNSCTSSLSNYKRAPLRKEIIDAWALQAKEDKELCYAGSWPGNQYRNQETQTGSPLTVVKSPERHHPNSEQEPVQSASNTTTDSGVGTDGSPPYGYPMAGQKNLHPSSNSAFSRLSLSPTQTLSLQDLQQGPSSPSKVQNQGEQQPSSPRKKIPPESPEQVVFGQFLLKPVNRRPCDAIGELETINKEMEDTISKRPNVGRCIDDLGLNKKLTWFKSGAHLTGPEPGREAISLPPMHMEKVSNIKKRSKSFASATDMDPRSIFHMKHTNNTTQKNELSILPHPSTNSLLSSVPLHNEPNQLYRQDIPVPQESLLRDVGLTVYTETPGGPGEPMQRSLSVPTTLDYKALGHSVQLSCVTRSVSVEKSSCSEHKSNKELEHGANSERKVKSATVSPFRREVIARLGENKGDTSETLQKDRTQHTTKQTSPMSLDVEDDGRYALTEPLSYKNDSTMADKHLESLLIKEKANALPTEDLSNLYEVKYGKGIPENESIEARAARILGIAVPVEALVEADKQPEDSLEDEGAILAVEPASPNAEMEQVIEESEEVKEESLIIQGADTREVKETLPGMDQENELKHISISSDGGDNQCTETHSVLDLPEFPPSKLPLSLPPNPDETLALSIHSEETKQREAACRQTDSLQDKMNCTMDPSGTSLARSTTDTKASQRDLDSVSPVKCLTSPEYGGQVNSKETEEVGKDFEAQEESQEEVVNQQVEKEEEEKMEEKGEEEVNRVKHIELGDLDGPKEENTEEQRVEGKTEETTVETEQSKDVNAEFKLDAGKLEEDKESPLGKDDHTIVVVGRAEATRHAVGGKMAKAKQRTRLQKPPLLPKPRSVPKREITLPLSFSSGTCGPTNVEDEEMLSASDSYDPSRVERV